MGHVPRVYARGRLRAGPLTITGEQARHLSGALRLLPGDPFLAFAGDGREWSARVTAIGRDRVTADVVELARMEPPSQPAIELWCGLIRAQRFDLVVEKATEAGAEVIRPLISKHAARGHEASPARLERWRRIAVEAAEQSGRLYLPVVEAPAAFESLISRRSPLVLADAAGIGWAEARALLPASGTVIAAVGPEGGFAPEEVQAARAAGALVVSLGPNVLRTETAAIVLTAFIRGG